MTEATTKKDPFDFLFFYDESDLGEREEDALLVGDDPSTASPLHLAIGILDAAKIVIRPIPDVTTASSSNYHLKLQFTPGILLQPELITVEDDDWDLKVEEDTILYLLWKKQEEITLLDDEDRLELILNGVMGTLAPAVRTSQTNVTLSWEFKRGTITVIDVTAKAPTDPYNNFAQETLEMIQRQGKANIPLYVGFFSSNRVLNTSNEESNLKLRITNTSESPITFNYDADATNRSQLIVALEVGEADTVPWALGTEDQVNNVVVTIAGDKWQPAGPTPNGSTLEWTFSPKSADISLAAKETLVIELKQIVTSHPTGTANLYLRYKYVPDYQDGEFICPIEKAPLVFHDVKVNDQLEHRVGIGTTTPATLLNVQDYLTLGNPDNNQKFVITSRAPQSGDFLQITNDKADGSWDWTQGITLRRGGKVGIGTADPQAKLHVNGGDALFSDNLNFGATTRQMLNLYQQSYGIGVQPGTMYFRTNSQFAWYIGGSHNDDLAEPSGGTLQMMLDGSGNVGIGTTSPSAKLHVVGTGTTFYSANSSNYDEVTMKNGNVGIGTKDPKSKLHIVGSATGPGTGAIIIENNGDADILYHNTSNDQKWQAGTRDDYWYVSDGAGQHLNVKHGGNVGIGTVNPQGKLDVHGGKIRINGEPAMKFITYNDLNASSDRLDTGIKSQKWQAIIAGFEIIAEGGIKGLKVILDDQDGKWWLRWDATDSDDTYAFVRVLYISKEFF